MVYCSIQNHTQDNSTTPASRALKHVFASCSHQSNHNSKLEDDAVFVHVFGVFLVSSYNVRCKNSIKGTLCFPIAST